MSKHRFFFHYNKPQSKKFGSPMVTVHYKGQCIVGKANDLIVKVETEGKINKKQPVFVMQGWCKSVNFQKAKGKIIIE